MQNTIDKFKRGTSFITLHQAVSKNELYTESVHDIDYHNQTILKFVPASGAATRMFENLYRYLEDKIDTDFTDTFFNHLEEYSFYSDLKLDQVEGKEEIIKTVLKAYGKAPKALIKIHQYDTDTVSPIEEHIYEAVEYIKKENLKIHFTISESHEQMFNDYLIPVNKDMVDISYSFQDKETDTIAVYDNNEPVVLSDGEILRRPGGHGALIYNLDKMDADVILIKNIDNVCHRSMIKDTIDSRKELISIGLNVQSKIYQYIQALLNDTYNIDEINSFLINVLNITYKRDLTKEVAYQFLNRPLRVCGVVKNEGEPGGGPFIIDNGDYLDPQILEMKEIDLDKDKDIVNDARFFNPVDLVCFTKDYKGNKFHLLDYINKERYFISDKSHEGKRIKAIEHPGLWNGAMHNWNTVFVEVPLTTFNPIKTVNDLLREGHLGKKLNT